MSRFLEANRTRMRKLSLWTAMIGLGCFVSGAVVPALIVRVVTELLRLPTFMHEDKRDQVQLCLVVLVMCVFGLVRYSI